VALGPKKSVAPKQKIIKAIEISGTQAKEGFGST